MERYNATKRASIFGLIGNIFLMVIKGLIGIISGSQAMIADAMNSASDIFASFMTFIGNKIASEPNDEKHNYGHGKAEYIFAMFISCSMMAIAIILLINSVVSLLNKAEFTFSWSLVVICGVTIIVKFTLWIYSNKVYKKYNNILLKANMIDHRNDCIIATITLIAILLSQLDIYWFDSLTGIGISIWIFSVGIKIFMESYDVLMDASIDEETKKTILSIVSTYEDIKNVSGFYSAPVGQNYTIIINICVDGAISTFESHKLADDLEKQLETLEKVNNAIIHVNPIFMSTQYK